VVEISLNKIKNINLLPYQERIIQRLYKIIYWLFSGHPTIAPLYNYLSFRGFLLYGPPGTGKTEIAFQVAKKILEEGFPETQILFIDGGEIASPKWGEAEEKLNSVFEVGSWKKIIIIDDIESLMLSRGATIAKEWHYSINSVLFHRLDMLNPKKCIVIATTNRIDLVDDALKSRLYPIEIPEVPKEDLVIFLKYITKEIGKINEELATKIFNKIKPQIEKGDIVELRQVINSVTVLFLSEL